MPDVNQPSIYELSSVEGILIRPWVFWEDDNDVQLVTDQRRIREQCESLVERIAQSRDEKYRSKEFILFMGKFYLGEESLTPWSTADSRIHSRQFIDLLIERSDFGEICEETIIEKVQSILQDMKNAGLSNEVSNSGYRKTSSLKISGKLVGNSYTKMLDKMEEFKKNHITELGYLNILIQKTSLERNWRFILPLLLAFLDDTDVLVKREAAMLLDAICERVIATESISSNIVLKSQTMPLFKTAIQPLLMALPSLTPEPKSIKILFAAYNTMFDVLQISILDKLEYYSAMSAVLNDTLLPSIGKCKDYVQVLLELTRILHDFIQRCGDFSRVLTKQIVYTLLTVLMDPYISYAPDVVFSILSVIQQCLENLSSERRKKFKYDILGCMGTLKRRLQNRDYSAANLQTQIDNLVNCANS